MTLLGKLDANADRALQMMVSNSSSFQYFIMNTRFLGDLFVMWQTGKSVKEFSLDKNIPSYQKNDKLAKINLVKKAVLKNTFTDTTLFAMRRDQSSPIVVADGIHRAIGIYRAISENPDIEENICLRILIFEGEEIANLDDYIKSIA